MRDFLTLLLMPWKSDGLLTFNERMMFCCLFWAVLLQVVVISLTLYKEVN